ncbi:response regulator [Leptolyngbya sp. NK1-12]|uniref:Response regulator n=1 Tax=Leptolyngbya sp. NK1-12 TaxID=2547451 RepID=A0AA96WP04_9CYAN|nr:response regulator [Leptolyngbya sp. NK1-12]
MKILAVEDDVWMASALADTLTQQNYTVEIAADGQAGWELAIGTDYDLILLDITLPRLDGITLCRKLRQEGDQTPILLLTAKDTQSDKVMGLDAGADDYLAKPFDFQELLARVRALLRRGNSALPPVLEWGNLRLDPSLCEVTCNGETLHLTRKEYGLLELFLRNQHRIFSPSAIIERLWAFENSPRESTIKSHVKALRQKLKAAGMDPDCIETVYGLGYRLKPSEEDSQENSRKNSRKNAQENRQSDRSAEATPNDVEQKITAAVMQARDAFKAQIGARLTVLQQTAEALAQSNLSETLRNQAEQEAHKLAGTLGTFGLAEASGLAEAIEDLLQSRPLTQQNADSLQQLVTRLYRELEQSPPASISLPAPPDPATGELPLLLIISQDEQMAEQWLKEASQGMRVEVIFPPIAAGMNGPELNPIVLKKPDAILLDLDAGERKQDSLQLLSALSKQLPSVPVLAWTEQDNLSDRLEVVRRGGHGFLHPSMPIAQGIEHIAQVLQPVHADEAEILVVDDDPVVLNTVRALLQPWGMQITTLDTPQQFWEVLNNVSPDLLILDVQMPDINGIELCQVIRADPQWSKLPVLFLTAHTDTNTVHQVFIAKADDCVSKASMGAKLVPRVLSCLERSF